MSYIIFDGHKIGNLSTGDTGWEASVFPIQIDSTPSREFEVHEPVGRIGNIIIDNKRYADVEQSYWVVVRENADAAFHEIAGFLQSRTGYCRLSDSWHADEYYQAYISEPIEPIFDKNRETVKFVVYFTRKPQRYLVSGEESVVTTTSSTDYADFTNPTPFAASPLITWTVPQDYSSSVKAVQICNIRYANNPSPNTGMGGVEYKVGFYHPTAINHIFGYGARVTVDFGSLSAYKGSDALGNKYNLNQYFLITRGSSDFHPAGAVDFFTLPGNMKKFIEVPADIPTLQFYPRWWRL